ncbi:RNA polymerase sigma factor [Lunatimonas salinarum]|uniref:RNA polymerase sigma factor n=1 Tax=Lunatimonas salinarum TaxID=1774590 RepID=UPI001ADF83F6|nr:sigma-70 family RNA polymerase sigma factor [Lunatimonas salinarum]
MEPRKHPSLSTREISNEPSRVFSVSDRELWDRFCAGDEGSFVTIYQTHVNHLFHFGCQFCQDKELIKDLLQDFFIYLRSNRKRFGSTDSIKFYLLKSFRRKIMATLKRIKRGTEDRQRFLMDQFTVELSCEAKFIQQQLETDMIRDLNQAIASLDSREREAIYYFYYQGLGYDQIAEIFEFAYVSSARRMIYKSLAKLRKLMVVSALSFFVVVKPLD